jgi:hypothetical protein
MEAAERDTTDEWRIAPGRAPATVAELEGRIDVALATARSAEEAALEIGAAGLEAAEQARRAAALAERAGASAARAAESVREAALTPAPSEPDPPTAAPAANGVAPRRPDPFEDRVTAFRLRAERVMIRLQKIEAGAPSHEPTEVVRLS